MKNKIPKESIFKKKGFYVALYSCLGVVMVMAAVVSFTNLSTPGKMALAPEEAPREANVVDVTELETTINSTSESYLTPEDISLVNTKTSSTPLPSPQTKPSEIKPQSVEPQATSKPESPATGTAPAASPKPAEEKKTAQENEAANEGAQAQVEETEDAVATFTGFSEDDKMAWPVLGDVVMEFSDAHAIYDKTLDQYRTNDTMCIAADLGAQVMASSAGVVKDVYKSKETGNTVVIDNGNGWMTTYSQLQDGVLVKTGDVVKKGQVIGGVASPSIYSVLLGNHVGFKVTRNEALVNPASVLE